jgi:hypothetical protein
LRNFFDFFFWLSVCWLRFVYVDTRPKGISINTSVVVICEGNNCYDHKSLILQCTKKGIAMTTRVFSLSSTHIHIPWNICKSLYLYEDNRLRKIFGLVSSVFLVQISDKIDKWIRQQQKTAIFLMRLSLIFLLEAEEIGNRIGSQAVVKTL